MLIVGNLFRPNRFGLSLFRAKVWRKSLRRREMMI